MTFFILDWDLWDYWDQYDKVPGEWIITDLNNLLNKSVEQRTLMLLSY